MLNQFYTIKTLTPLHCGIGQGLNDIDLPVSRNAVSKHPNIPASTIKGVLKDEYINNQQGGKNAETLNESDWKTKFTALFGGDGSAQFSSAISIEDANLLALPVRSFYGTFAYLCSPYTLQVLKQLLKRTGEHDKLPALPDFNKDNNKQLNIHLPKETLLDDNTNMVLLEELDLKVDKKGEPLATQWAAIIAGIYFPNDQEAQKIFSARFAIVDDNALNFICESGLPVDARIRINQKTGTVMDGALWYEESVPAESLFCGIMGIDHSFSKDCSSKAEELKKLLTTKRTIHCQVGGKSTTGKGLIELNYATIK